MIKKNHIYEFTKLPTSEAEANSQITEEKQSDIDIESKEKYNLFKNKWFIIFMIIFIIIFLLWISFEIYLILFNYNIITWQSKLSIIINIFDKKHNLTYLLRTLMDQSINSYEIIITKNFKSNYSFLAFDKFKRKNVKIKIIDYNENDTNIKIRIDSAMKATGEYILFLNPEDIFSDDCLGKYYKIATRNNYDITSFDSFHEKYFVHNIYNQPQLFDAMFFIKDSIQQNEFHLSEKIIKKEIFLESVKDFDNFYLENHNKYFEQSMLLFKIFKKAKNFKKVKGNTINGKCNKYFCPKSLMDKDGYNKAELRDILIYLKFLIQNTDNKVLEKRVAAKFFIDILVKKKYTKYNFRKNKELIGLLNEIIRLYSNCDIISEYDIKTIKDFGESIKV